MAEEELLSILKTLRPKGTSENFSTKSSLLWGGTSAGRFWGKGSPGIFMNEFSVTGLSPSKIGSGARKEKTDLRNHLEEFFGQITRRVPQGKKSTGILYTKADEGKQVELFSIKGESEENIARISVRGLRWRGLWANA